MKKLLLLLVLLMMVAPSVSANDLWVNYVDTFTDGDTDDIRVDPVYTTIMRIDKWAMYWFKIQIDNGYDNLPDTNFANDSVFVAFQHSFDKQTWTTGLALSAGIALGEADTIVTVAASLNLDSTYTETWGRARFIYTDSVTSTPELDGESFYRKFTAWFMGKY